MAQSGSNLLIFSQIESQTSHALQVLRQGQSGRGWSPRRLRRSRLFMAALTTALPDLPPLLQSGLSWARRPAAQGLAPNVTAATRTWLENAMPTQIRCSLTIYPAPLHSNCAS